MSSPPPRRGATQRRVYGNAVPGGTAARLIVLSRQAWNDRVDDCVVVPCFNLPGRTPSDLLIHVSGDVFADCTRVQSVPQDELGPDDGYLAHVLWTRVRIGVRIFLRIDQLKAERPCAPPSNPNPGWWPHQADVRYRYVPAALADKMHAVITEDAWNAQQPYSCAAQLTSTSKEWRQRWEAHVPGGNAVAGDIVAVPHADFDPKPPRSPRPDRLTPAEMKQLAASLQDVLSLG